MRSSTPPNFVGRCRGCFLPLGSCVCRSLPRVATRAHFYIVRHMLESWKTTNTGRLAALALTNSSIVEHGLPFEAVAPPRNLSGSWLLFPDDAAPRPQGRPDNVVVLDGTWHQARRMLQRIPWLRGLPRFSLQSPSLPDGLRRAPNRFAMSTLTAVARAVEVLEGPDAALPLDVLHREFVERVRALKGGPATLEGPRHARTRHKRRTAQA